MELTRRRLLATGLGAVLAGRLSPLLGQEAGTASARRCIVLWMGGGPSHVDTWDPKKGNGPFKAIETATRGVHISEHLPRLAKQADLYTIVRSVTSKEGEHERATALLHTGHLPQETVTYPTLGAVASRQWKPQGELPLFVCVGEEGYDEPGFLGSQHGPFRVEGENPTERLEVPEQVRRRSGRRLKLLGELDRQFAERGDPRTAREERELQARARTYLDPSVVEAFDVAKESDAVRRAYGETPFGRGCLLARRLVEKGVRFVEVVLDGWDTHEENFPQVKELSDQLDPAMSSLLRELKQKRLLDETLVVWMGEFGRTPEVNGSNGRDHHPDAFSVVLAGGGVAGGRVIGKTDANGDKVTDRPVTVPDLQATLYAALGFDPHKEYQTPGGRPIQLLETGTVVRELLG